MVGLDPQKYIASVSPHLFLGLGALLRIEIASLIDWKNFEHMVKELLDSLKDFCTENFFKKHSLLTDFVPRPLTRSSFEDCLFRRTAESVDLSTSVHDTVPQDTKELDPLRPEFVNSSPLFLCMGIWGDKVFAEKASGVMKVRRLPDGLFVIFVSLLWGQFSSLPKLEADIFKLCFSI